MRGQEALRSINQAMATMGHGRETHVQEALTMDLRKLAVQQDALTVSVL